MENRTKIPQTSTDIMDVTKLTKEELKGLLEFMNTTNAYSVTFSLTHPIDGRVLSCIKITRAIILRRLKEMEGGNNGEQNI